MLSVAILLSKIDRSFDRLFNIFKNRDLTRP